jgi:hypothetical protein
VIESVKGKKGHTINPPLSDIMFRLMIDMRVVQHRFRRDTANVQTCSTEGAAFFDASGL